METERTPINLLSGSLDQFLTRFVSDANLLTIWSVAVILAAALIVEMISWSFVYRLSLLGRIVVAVLWLSFIGCLVASWLYLGYRWLGWLDYKAAPSTVSQPSPYLPLVGHLNYYQLQQLLVEVVKGAFVTVCIISLHLTGLLIMQGMRVCWSGLKSVVRRAGSACINTLLGNRSIDLHGPGFD